MKVRCNCGSKFFPEKIIIDGGKSVTIFDISSGYQDGNFNCPSCDQVYYVQLHAIDF
jgi:hypothetical protein